MWNHFWGVRFPTGPLVTDTRLPVFYDERNPSSDNTINKLLLVFKYWRDDHLVLCSLSYRKCDQGMGAAIACTTNNNFGCRMLTADDTIAFERAGIWSILLRLNLFGFSDKQSIETAKHRWDGEGCLASLCLVSNVWMFYCGWEVVIPGSPCKVLTVITPQFQVHKTSRWPLFFNSTIINSWTPGLSLAYRQHWSISTCVDHQLMLCLADRQNNFHSLSIETMVATFRIL